MRKRYVQHPITLKLIPAEEYVRPDMTRHSIHGEIEPFVSHVDGTVIDSRKKLREHNERHGVVSAAEMGNEGEQAKKEREKFYTAGGYDNQRRTNAVRFAFELEQSGRQGHDKKQMIENYQNLNESKR